MSKRYTWRVAAKLRYYTDRQGNVVPFKLGAADTSNKLTLQEIPLVSRDFSTYWLNKSQAQGTSYFNSGFLDDVIRVATEQGVEDIYATDEERGFNLYDLWLVNGRVTDEELEREASG